MRSQGRTRSDYGARRGKRSPGRENPGDFEHKLKPDDANSRGALHQNGGIMWHVIQDGQLVPLALINGRVAIDRALRGHDATHGGAEFPFCEDYGCGSIVEIASALDEPTPEMR